MDIRKNSEDRMNTIDKIIMSIPGFRGYYQREFRRDSDKLQREFIIGKLRDIKNKLTDIIKEVAQKKRLDLLTDYDEIMREMDKFINEVKYADSGYSGFFDLVKIDESQLEAIYSFDVDLLDQVLGFSLKMETLSAEPLNRAEVRLVKNNLVNIVTGFKNRNEILHGFYKE